MHCPRVQTATTVVVTEQRLSLSYRCEPDQNRHTHARSRWIDVTIDGLDGYRFDEHAIARLTVEVGRSLYGPVVLAIRFEAISK